MSIRDELLAAEERAWQANLAGDGGFYQKAVTDEALSVSPWGVADKSAVVAAMTANEVPYTGFSLDEATVVPLDTDSALITYAATVHGERGGEPFTMTAYTTSVYVRRDGEWLIAFNQQTLPAAG